jgi:uncharacterized protein YndB with AHSA1/START domain
MTEGDTIEVSVHVAAQPEIVFPYFTDPRRYVQWMGRDATLEAVPGGCYRVHIRDGIEAVGEFVEVDPPRRLVFTWGWTHDHEVPAGTTRVVITLHARTAAPASSCVTTTCPMPGSGITTARAGTSTSTDSARASAARILARTRTRDWVRSHLWPLADAQWPRPAVRMAYGAATSGRKRS